MANIYTSADQLIGKTPLLELTHIEKEEGPAELYSAAITGLQLKRLIRVDYDLPLLNFDYAAYGAYPCRGSMALTERGQAAVELLEIQGAEP